MNTTTDVNTDLIATCWTSAGNVTPMAASEKSAFDIQDRVREVAATGWSGIGIAHDDLKHIVETIGFPALSESIAAAGLSTPKSNSSTTGGKPPIRGSSRVKRARRKFKSRRPHYVRGSVGSSVRLGRLLTSVRRQSPLPASPPPPSPAPSPCRC
jgi:hypothetical protein